MGINMKKKWTGERLETFVFNDTTVEHLHRYGIVMPFAENKVVLDIACGEGYGSKLLSAKASKVYGVDIDPVTVQNATNKYKAPNLSFIQGSADKIPLADSSVDTVVSFETIEHHDKHGEMLNEIKRVLKPGGILIMSSPEKAGEVSFNEFHVKELSRAEFVDLIEAHFKFAKFYSQKITFGSVIAPVEKGSGNTFEYENGDFEKINAHNEIPGYVFNLCIATDRSEISLPISFFDGRDILLENLLRPYHSSRLYRLSKLIKKLLPI
jgi:2-polyprenyl-3-methyl-5-hydroxy-6-metoxy-1,4-benzoquinol methylase